MFAGRSSEMNSISFFIQAMNGNQIRLAGIMEGYAFAGATGDWQVVIVKTA
jgi:hypothetical protein